MSSDAATDDLLFLIEFNNYTLTSLKSFNHLTPTVDTWVQL